MSSDNTGRRNLWFHPPPIIRQYFKVVGFATAIFGVIVLSVTAIFGYIVVHLGQLGPYANKVLNKLLPMIGIGLMVEVIVFGFAAYFLATYLAYKMAGPFVRLERELEISLKQGIARPLRVRQGDAMEGFISKINALIEFVSKKKDIS